MTAKGLAGGETLQGSDVRYWGDEGHGAMRYIAMTFCVLTVMFTGGCLVMFTSSGDWNDIVMTRAGAVLALATIANIAFVWLIWKHAPGRLLMTLGVVYVAVQCALAWSMNLWNDIGVEFLALVIVVFAFKGALLVFAGKSEDVGVE